MRTIFIVLGVLTALVLLPLLAFPLLIVGGIGVGAAVLAGSAAMFAVPLAIGVAALGVIGLVLRLVFGLLGLVFSLIGTLLAGLFSLLLLPFVLLPLILPALLVGGLIWWAVRASRNNAQGALPAPDANTL